MPGKHTILRAGLLASALTLVLAATASAHVTVDPAEAPSDGYATVRFEVPHGCEESPTTQVRIKIPPSVPSATPAVNPLWNVTTKEGRKDRVELHGETVTTGVSEVIYTARQPLPADRLDFLSLSLKLPAAKPGTTVAFPVVQRCAEGITRWIQIPAEGENPNELESPAPVIALTKAEGHSASSSEKPEVRSAGASIRDGEDAPLWLVVVALALGAAGLLTGLGALLRSRRAA